MVENPEELQEGTAECLRELLGVSQTTINNCVRRGIFGERPTNKGRRKLYDLPACTRAYLEWRLHSGSASARARKYEEEVRKLRLYNAERERQLVDSGAISELFVEYCSLVRDGVLRMPGRLASELTGMSKPPEIRALIHVEVTELLEEAAGIFASVRSPEKTSHVP
jgi:phage terminase Nu1 subunit (DNA packaging protein)